MSTILQPINSLPFLTALPRSTRPDFTSFATDPSLLSVNLAFDPSKSSHYKVVYVYLSDTSPGQYEIEIYSSETGLWKPSGQPFLADVSFHGGIFCNGAIHWLATRYASSTLYFDVNEERLGVIPLPLVVENEETMLRFGTESRDHLHLIHIVDHPTTKFNVYELERDYSGWFLKYKVDLGDIINAFPETICGYVDPTDMNNYKYSVLSVVREENEEESFMVLLVPGKAIRYKFSDKSFKEICVLDPNLTDGEECYFMFNVFQFVESLAGV